jgi:hypothetical protein
LRNCFEELKEIAANRSRAYRGYLLNERLQPAEIKRIAQWIGEDISTTKKLLSELESIGLIEKVNLPEINPAVDDILLTDKNKIPKKSTKFRRTPENTGNPLKTRRSINRTASGKNKRKNKPVNKADGKVESKGKNKPNTTTSPTTTPMPIKPKEAEAGAGKLLSRADLPRPVYHLPERLGEVLGRNPILFSDQAKEFGKLIYQALKVPYKPNTLNGIRELSVFARCWLRAETAGIDSSSLSILHHKSIKDAVTIGNQRSYKLYRKSPEAVWTYQFNRRFESMTKISNAG